MYSVSDLITYHLIHWSAATADVPSVVNMIELIDADVPEALAACDAFRVASDRVATMGAVALLRRYRNYLAWAETVFAARRMYSHVADARLAREVIDRYFAG